MGNEWNKQILITFNIINLDKLKSVGTFPRKINFTYFNKLMIETLLKEKKISRSSIIIIYKVVAKEEWDLPSQPVSNKPLK